MSRKKLKAIKRKPSKHEPEISNRKVVLSSKDGITTLNAVREIIENHCENRISKAQECGCANDCMDCFQLAWCITHETEQKLLGIE